MTGNIGNFTLGIQLEMKDNGDLKCNTSWLNNNVPIEMIAMQIKAFLEQTKNEYFLNFDKETGSKK